MNRKLSLSMLVISGLFFVAAKSSQYNAKERHHQNMADCTRLQTEQFAKNRTAREAILGQHANRKANERGYSEQQRSAQNEKIKGMPSNQQKEKFRNAQYGQWEEHYQKGYPDRHPLGNRR